MPCVRAKSARVMRVVPSSSSLARAGGTERPPLLSWPARDVLECLLPRANCVVPVPMAIGGFVASAGSRLVHCLTTHETEQDTGNSAVTGACIWLLQEQTSRSTFIMHASCQPGGRSPRQPVRLAGLHAQMSTPLQFPASGSPAAAIEGLPGQPRRE